MSNEFNIGVRFGGDLTGLETASKGAAAALTNVKNSAGSVAPALSQIGPAAVKAAVGVERLRTSMSLPSGGAVGFAQSFQSAIRSIDDLESEIDQLEGAIRHSTDPAHINRLSKAVGELQRQINNIKVIGFETSIKNISAGSGAAAAALSKLKAPAAAANGAMTDFSRVLQDLPFGTVGIVNNLTQLPDTLNRLSVAAKESGKSVGSLLLSSIKGFGGIGLAISAITSGILIYQNGISGFFKGAANGAKEAKEKADEYQASLKSIGSELAQEATKVARLVVALQGETLSRKEKAAALEELKRISPEYFGQLKIEEGQIKNLTLAYGAYVKALRSRAEAKVLENQVQKLFEKKFEIQATLKPGVASEEVFNEVNTLRKRIAEFQKQVDAQPVKGDIFGKGLTDAEKQLNNLKQALLSITGTNFNFNLQSGQRKLDGIDAQINTILLRADELSKVDLKIPETKEDKQDATLKRLKDELQGLQKQLEVTNKLREAGVLPIHRENDALELQLKILSKLNEIDAREVVIKTKPKLEIDPVLNELEIQKAFKEGGIRQGVKVEIPIIVAPKVQIDVAAATGNSNITIDTAAIAKNLRANLSGLKSQIEVILDEFNQSINAAIQSGLIDAFSGIGEGIGNAIAGGFNLQNLLQPLAGAVAGLLSSLGKLAIQAGVKILLAKKALQFAVSNPAILIAGGIALVAAGAALKSSFEKQKVPAFADGVRDFSGGLAVVGERGPELVNLPRGSDVIPNHMIGGGQQIVLQPAISFSGDQFRFMLNKVDARKRRV